MRLAVVAKRCSTKSRNKNPNIQNNSSLKSSLLGPNIIQNNTVLTSPMISDKIYDNMLKKLKKCTKSTCDDLSEKFEKTLDIDKMQKQFLIIA